MAKTNDTENPSQHQHIPLSMADLLGIPDTLSGTIDQLAVLENFLQHQMEIVQQLPPDTLEPKHNQQQALIHLLATQVDNVKTTLNAEVTALRLTPVHTQSNGTLLTAAELKAWYKELTEDKTATEIQRRWNNNA